MFPFLDLGVLGDLGVVGFDEVVDVELFFDFDHGEFRAFGVFSSRGVLVGAVDLLELGGLGHFTAIVDLVE